MKTVIIGGGKGCQAIIELATGAFLKEFTLNIQRVIDLNNDAPGMQYARKLGIVTGRDMAEALALPGIELVIELTGQDSVLEKIYRVLPPGVRLIDHSFARIFWDLVNARQERERQLQEITELEQEIEKERYFLQSLFDAIPDLVMVFDRNMRTVKINAGFSLYAGVTHEQVLGASCNELLAGTDLIDFCDELLDTLDSVLKSSQPLTLIWQTTIPEETHWEVTFTPIIHGDSEPEAVIATWHRITEKVILHRKIKRAEDRLKSFIDSAHDWISIKGLDCRYLVVNPICSHSFNLEPEDFIGKRPEEVLPPDVAKVINKHDREVLNSKRHQTFNEIIQINGRNHHYQTVRFPMTDHDGEVIGVCTIARDVTSERELHDQLAQAAKLAAVGRLAAGIAHEINNPLTGILAYAEDACEELSESDSLREDLNIVIQETLRCREIVRNLLDFARPGALRLAKTSPNQVISQSLLLVRKLPQFRNIAIRERLNRNIPEIMCDSQQLQQVILNLMLNSADAMKESGEIILATEYDNARDKCLITVADNGPGIPDDIIGKIFEPFFSTKGTNGLGLAVSWGIIERHQGIFGVHRSPGGGALFEIAFSPAAGND